MEYSGCMRDSTNADLTVAHRLRVARARLKSAATYNFFLPRGFRACSLPTAPIPTSESMAEHHEEAGDVVQRLEEPEEGTFLDEEDVLEVEELEIDNDGMEVESDDEAGGSGGDDDEDGEERDGADDLLDNGFDDSTASFRGHGESGAAVFAVALHPIDPLVAVSGGEDDLAHLWRTDTGAEIIALAGHSDSVTSVGFSFDGEMVATGGMDGRVRVWRKVKGSEGYLSWEFLTNLEGPDEVNVSAGFAVPRADSEGEADTRWDWYGV